MPRVFARLGRWLMHWSFWPAYAGLLTLFMLWLEPWRKWYSAEEYRREHPTATLRLRGVADAVSAHSDDPAGTVCAVRSAEPIDEPPDGWLPCDGRWVLRVGHPELFAVIGERFGGQDAMFRLPDYRGLAFPSEPDVPSRRLWSLTVAEAVAGRDEQVGFWIRSR